MTARVLADSLSDTPASTGDYSAYRERVLRPLRRRFPTLNAHDFDDIWQDAQLKVYTREAAGEQIDNVAGLLWQVALFEALSVLKRYGRRNDQARLNDGYEHRLTAGGGSSPTTLLEAGTLAESIREALEQLPERCRQVVLLRFVEELPPGQIASLLGILERTVHREIGKAIDGIALNVTERWQAVTLDRKRVAELVAYTVDTLPQTKRDRLERELSDSPALANALRDLRTATRIAAAAVPLPLIPLPTTDRAGLLERFIQLFGSGGSDAVAPTVAGGSATAAGGGIFATLGGKVAAICAGGACVAAVTAIPVITSKGDGQRPSLKTTSPPSVTSVSTLDRRRSSRRAGNGGEKSNDQKRRVISPPPARAAAITPKRAAGSAPKKTGEFDLNP